MNYADRSAGIRPDLSATRINLLNITPISVKTLVPKF
jgi:hypothetical protein